MHPELWLVPTAACGCRFLYYCLLKSSFSNTAHVGGGQWALDPQTGGRPGAGAEGGGGSLHSSAASI